LGKQPVYRDDTRRLSRIVICILTPNAVTDTRLRKQQSAINFAKSTTRELINQSIESISEITDQILPIINLEMPNYYRSSANVVEGVQNISEARLARGCVLQNEIEDEVSPISQQDLGLSHLVAIQLTSANGGWHKSNGISSVRIETPVEKLSSLLHDIALDIAMFHSWPLLGEHYGFSIDKRIEFSRLKARFAAQVSKDTYYGPISEPIPDYISLASLSRQGSRFLPKDYLNLWEKFISSELLGIDETAITQKEDPVDEILKFHQQRGQISRKRLSKAVATLTPDVYLFVMTRKRPATKQARLKLAGLFKKKKYRQGLWLIIPFRDYRSNLNYLPFISLFKFRVGASSVSISAVSK